MLAYVGEFQLYSLCLIFCSARFFPLLLFILCPSDVETILSKEVTDLQLTSTWQKF